MCLGTELKFQNYFFDRVLKGLIFAVELNITNWEFLFKFLNVLTQGFYKK